MLKSENIIINRGKILSPRYVTFLAAKYFGLFKFCQYQNRRKLNILCYHGFSEKDIGKFNPELFISPERFDKRMKWLKNNGYNIVSLERGLNGLKNGGLPDNSVVVTIDDGFYTTYKEAIPILEKYQYPCTIYITTYYVIHPNPIFRLVIQYLFYTTKEVKLKLNDILSFLTKELVYREKDHVSAVWKIINYGERHLNESERVELLKKLAERLKVNYKILIRDKFLNLMTKEEIKELSQKGYDIQLHTHRHRLPLNFDKLLDEISENRKVLKPLVENSLKHLCYPSGVWREKHLPMLKDMGIVSATTCQVGMNTDQTNNLKLNRLLDSESVAQIDFEAEICGFKSILRKIAYKKEIHRK